MKSLQEKLLAHIEDQDRVIDKLHHDIDRLNNMVAALLIGVTSSKVNVFVREAAENLADAVVLGYTDSPLQFTVDYSNVNRLDVDATEKTAVDPSGAIYEVFDTAKLPGRASNKPVEH